MKTDTSLWNRFNPERYVEQNYGKLNVQDAVIISILIKRHKKIGHGLALEIGGCTNLYPILCMLPFYEHIYVTDVSPQNIAYFIDQQYKMYPVWDKFIDLIKIYAGVDDSINFQEALKKNVTVGMKSIGSLNPEAFESVSMNFVAESITDNMDAFEVICQQVIDCIKPSGYLTATFMSDSSGYEIDGVTFPAVPIREEHVNKSFCSLKKMGILRIPNFDSPFRKGYSGIIYLEGVK